MLFRRKARLRNVLLSCFKEDMDNTMYHTYNTTHLQDGQFEVSFLFLHVSFAVENPLKFLNI